MNFSLNNHEEGVALAQKTDERLFVFLNVNLD